MAEEALGNENYYRDPTPLGDTKNINALIEAIRSKEKGKDVREALARGLEVTFETAATEGNANMEVAKARGTFETLGDKLDDFNNKINSATSGSPKGVYANLSALQSALPNGDSNIYVTTDNGHWWYYSSGWKDGGAYQNSFVSNNTSFGILKGDLILSLPEMSVTVKNNPYYILSTSYKMIPEGTYPLTRSNGCLVFDTINNSMAMRKLGEVQSTDVVFGVIWSSGYFYINSLSSITVVTIEDKVIKKPAFGQDVSSKLIAVAAGTGGRIELTTSETGLVSSILVASGNNNLFFITDNGKTFNVTGPLNVDMNSSTYGLVVFNEETKQLRLLPFDRVAELTISDYIFATVWGTGIVNQFLSNLDIYINGINKIEGVATGSVARFATPKMFFEGDSITQGRLLNPGQYSERNYPVVVQERLGFSEIRNNAVSGAMLTETSTNSVTTRLKSLSASDLSKFDFYSIAAGTNDYNTGVLLGNINEDDTTKFIPALKTCIETIFTANPMAKIVLIVPHERFYGPENNKVKGISGLTTANASGLTLNDYCDAIVSVAKHYQIPVLDWRERGQIINKYNYQIITVDALHLTDQGYEEAGNRIASWLESIF